jgi:hypothetical protein
MAVVIVILFRCIETKFLPYLIYKKSIQKSVDIRYKPEVVDVFREAFANEEDDCSEDDEMLIESNRMFNISMNESMVSFDELNEDLHINNISNNDGIRLRDIDDNSPIRRSRNTTTNRIIKRLEDSESSGDDVVDENPAVDFDFRNWNETDQTLFEPMHNSSSSAATFIPKPSRFETINMSNAIIFESGSESSEADNSDNEDVRFAREFRGLDPIDIETDDNSEDEIEEEDDECG